VLDLGLLGERLEMVAVLRLSRGDRRRPNELPPRRARRELQKAELAAAVEVLADGEAKLPLLLDRHRRREARTVVEEQGVPGSDLYREFDVGDQPLPDFALAAAMNAGDNRVGPP
jgi:hypothetical protein